MKNLIIFTSLIISLNASNIQYKAKYDYKTQKTFQSKIKKPFESSLLYAKLKEIKDFDDKNKKHPKVNKQYNKIPFIKNKNKKTFQSKIEFKKPFESSLLYAKLKEIKDFDDKNRKYSELNEDYYKIQYKGNVGLEFKKYDYKIPFVKDKKQKTFQSKIELKKSFDNSLLIAKFEALKDFDDKNRKYSKLNELYYKYESDNYDLLLGKDIKYWGALELNNISDIYNEKNIINDPYDKDKKLGTKGITYNYYTKNEDSLSLIVSQDTKDDKKAIGYIKYSGSKDDIAQRDFSYILSSKDNIFTMFHTIIKNDTIYKLEYLYENKNKTYQAGIGIEHTLYGIISKKDLAILLEYYKSNNENVNYSNNIFLGSRLTFNNIQNSNINIGITKDNTKNKYSYLFEYKTRIYDYFKLKLSYLKNDSLSIGTFNFTYYF